MMEMEVNLYEVVPPGYNVRGDMGRVVVPPLPSPKKRRPLKPKKCSQIFVCCSRIFLTSKLLQAHRRSDCRQKNGGKMSPPDMIKALFERFKVRPEPEVVQEPAKAQNEEKEVDEDDDDILSTTEPVYTCTAIDVSGHSNTQDDDGMLNYFCNACPFWVSNVQKMCRHLKNGHSIKVPSSVVKITEEKVVSKGYSKARLQSCFFQCDKCDTFTTTCISSMVLHKQKAHDVNGKFPCPHCTCIYGTDNGLRIHIHRIHHDMAIFLDKPFVKPVTENPVNATTTQEDGQTKQLRTKDWVQQSCEISQTQPVEDTDTDFDYVVKPFRCNFCSKDFKKQSQLAEHKLNCHYTDNLSTVHSGSDTTKKSMPSEPRKIVNLLKEEVILLPMTPQKPAKEGKKRKLIDKDKSIKTEKSSKKPKVHPILQVAHPDPLEITCTPIILADLDKTERESLVDESTNGKSVSITLECEMCGYSAFDASDLEFHLKTAHVMLGVECECGCSFATATELTTHKNTGCRLNAAAEVEIELQLEHQSHIVDAEEELNVTITNASLEEDTAQNFPRGQHSCECGETFETRRDFRNHRTEGQCKVKMIEDELFMKDVQQRKSEKQMEAESRADSFICSICEKGFASEVGLQRHHVLMHTEEKDYTTCELCGYDTATRKFYKEHKMRCHTGTVPCPLCVCTFKEVDGLARHMKLLHKRKLEKTEYLLKCDHEQCEYTTYFAGSLEKHKKALHSVKPVKTDSLKRSVYAECEICKTRTSSLPDHLRRCHFENGIPCPENCGCSFQFERSLYLHMTRKHGKAFVTKKEKERSGFDVKCSQCEFRGKDENSLRIHCRKMHGLLFKVAFEGKRERRCDICNKLLTETLAQHKKRCHVENGFKCMHPGCTYSCETYISRAYHMSKAHNIQSVKRCNLCGLSYSTTFKDHCTRCHYPGGLQCEFCRCTFESEIGRVRHTMKRHSAKVDKKPCEICGIIPKFGNAQHMKLCHVPDGFQCNFCSYSLKNELGRARHMVKRHNIKMETHCELCGIKPRFGLTNHMNHSHYEGGLQCEYCPCTFKTERVKIFHLAKHHNLNVLPSPSLPCDICHMRVKNRVAHLRRHHVKDGHACTKCNWSLRTLEGLAIHMRKAHGEKIDYVRSPRPPRTPRDDIRRPCGICHIRVRNQAVHMMRHHAKDGYECNKCNWSMRTQEGLAIHMRKAHGEKIDYVQSPRPSRPPRDDMRTPCEICNMRISNHSDHMMRHHVKDGHACNKCNWSLRSIEGLAIHMRKAHGERLEYIRKPVEERISPTTKCELCGAKMNRATLKKHLEFNHSSSHNFKCHFCSCRFAKNIGRYHHIQRMHKDEEGALEVLEKFRKKRPGRGQQSSIAAMKLKIVSITSCSKNDDDPEAPSPSTSSFSEDNNKSEKVVASPMEELHCKNCGYLASCKSHLNIHVQKSHVKNTKFGCSNCTCSFATEEELARHVRISHSSEERIFVTNE